MKIYSCKFAPLKSEKTKKGGFSCCHCGGWVSLHKFMGTRHRNHCPFCLWSKHVDFKKPGNRKSPCQAEMEPIGLTFKQEGIDKYGKPRQGELMLIHQCNGCDKIAINRIAGDDNPEVILKVFQKSLILDEQLKRKLEKGEIRLLTGKDEKQIRLQLFGNIEFF